MNKLGIFVKAKREELGLSLREFAKRCNLSHSYIDNIEKGYDSKTQKPMSPTLETLNKLAEGLAIPVSEIIFESGITSTEFLPNRLRKIRINHPQKELRSGNAIAELMNISPQYYYDLETGRNNCRLNADHLAKLTKIFNCTADEILGGQPLETDEPSEIKKPKDLSKFLEQSEVMFDGELYDLDEEDKETLRKALEFAFWQAKQKNKRNKSK